MIALEDKLKEHHNDYIIIRPGGLYDQRRHPGKFLSGKDVQVGSEERINLISGDDLVEIIIKSCICKKMIINAVNSSHPLKHQFYTKYCEVNHLALPNFKLTEKDGNIVSTIYPEFVISTPLL